MDNIINDYACKEAWEVLKKLPLNIISKIPFDIRNGIAEKAQKCIIDIGEIDTTVNLKDMKITDEAKDILMSLYIKYLSSSEMQSKLNEYINFCDKQINGV